MQLVSGWKGPTKGHGDLFWNLHSTPSAGCLDAGFQEVKYTVPTKESEPMLTRSPLLCAGFTSSSDLEIKPNLISMRKSHLGACDAS